MSVEKNANIIYDPKIKRIVEYNDDDKQINILDQRFYKRDNKYYPSVSTILQVYPKGKHFEDWLKSNGYNSDIIAAKAASEGTQIHKTIENFLKGDEIQWVDEFGRTKYSLEVWKMILKFVDFWNTYKPELVALEYTLFSDTYKFAGTADLIIKFLGTLWLIDIKTSNSLHVTYNLQLSAYATAWNEMHTDKIEQTGILWLKANTRGEGKNGKIQGKGWELKNINNIENNFNIFKHTYEIYKIENPEFKPVTEILPTSVKML